MRRDGPNESSISKLEGQDQRTDRDNQSGEEKLRAGIWQTKLQGKCWVNEWAGGKQKAEPRVWLDHRKLVQRHKHEGQRNRRAQRSRAQRGHERKKETKGQSGTDKRAVREPLLVAADQPVRHGVQLHREWNKRYSELGNGDSARIPDWLCEGTPGPQVRQEIWQVIWKHHKLLIIWSLWEISVTISSSTCLWSPTLFLTGARPCPQ